MSFSMEKSRFFVVYELKLVWRTLCVAKLILAWFLSAGQKTNSGNYWQCYQYYYNIRAQLVKLNAELESALNSGS